MNRITVLVADDHALCREGLVMLLAQEEDIQVVGEAADDLQVISLAEAIQPDILLLGVQMSGLSSIEVLSRIHEKSPRTKVLMVSSVPENKFIIEALERGARGCLSKSLARKDFVKAIRATYYGEIWVERRVLTQVLESLCRKVHGTSALFLETQEALTDREREIVKWAIQGMTNKEIAARLGISDKTVKTHLSNIFNKLKINRRLQLALCGIVEQPD
jgi:two-component system NarL family response regulator